MTPAEEKLLKVSGMVFAVGSAVHVFDHLRRGQGSVSEPLYWAGNAALVMQVAVITLILVGHRLAPLVAAPAGFVLAAGFFTAHWLPRFGPLSDPVWEIESAAWFSAVAAALEILGALAVALAGTAVLRRQGLHSLAAPRRAGRAEA